jgi:EmrB/QacA subfamily drug resistance transporter
MTSSAAASAASAAAPTAFTPLAPAKFRAAIAVVLITMLLAALDQTIVSVAVPTIAQQLGGFEWMAWVVSGYLIAATVVTPLYGKFGDLYGRRRVMSVAIGLFTLASIACALAQTLPQLVLARIAQGVGGGGLIALAQALVADVVPMRERGRYQSYISMVWAAASVSGPLVGGAVTQFLSWPWIFWINLPVGVLALALVRSALPRHVSDGRPRPPIDWGGAGLLLLGLVALLLPISRVGQGVRLHEPLNLALLLTSLIALAWFWRHEQRAAAPILPAALLRNRTVLACSTMLFVSFFVFIALSVLVPLRLQLVGGLGEGAASLRLLPLTLGIPVGAFSCGRYMHATGRVRAPQRVGAVLVPLALAAYALLPPSQVAAGSVALLLMGVGIGFQLPTGLLTVQNAVPQDEVGTVTGLTAFFRQLGGAVGIAVLSAVLLALLRDHLPAGAGALGAEGLGALLAQARSGPTPGGAASDAAFRHTMLFGAALSLLAVWCARFLPDTRLQGSAAAAVAEG